MDDAMKDLGRRAIAAGWRSADGELTACGLRIVEGGDGYAIGHRAGATQDGGGWYDGPYDGMIPDFSDPATLGCLDAQLAERFGCPVIVTPFGKMFRAWRMLPPDVDEFDYRLCAIRTATTPAGAKVAALEAAPKVAP